MKNDNIKNKFDKNKKDDQLNDENDENINDYIQDIKNDVSKGEKIRIDLKNLRISNNTQD